MVHLPECSILVVLIRVIRPKGSFKKVAVFAFDHPKAMLCYVYLSMSELLSD